MIAFDAEKAVATVAQLNGPDPSFCNTEFAPPCAAGQAYETELIEARFVAVIAPLDSVPVVEIFLFPNAVLIFDPSMFAAVLMSAFMIELSWISTSVTTKFCQLGVPPLAL